MAAVGLEHRHICDLVAELTAAGAQCAGDCPETPDTRVLEGFRQRSPYLAAVDRFIELRGYVDTAGRPGTDHVVLSNQDDARHTDASGEPLTYFAHFPADVRDRTQTAPLQGHAFTVSRGSSRVNVCLTS